MNYHNSPDFKDAIAATAQQLQIRPILVEKDYWVTYVLKNLSDSKYRNQVVFKGGTSLSKAYNCIYRFSEDIDLAILNEENLKDGQLKNLMKEIETQIKNDLELIPGHPNEIKRGRNRTTVYNYPKTLSDKNFGAIKDVIQLEINTFTNPVPYNTLEIQSYLAQFLTESGNNADIQKYNLQPFPLQVLALERTFFEKLLSINRLSYIGVDTLKGKIRHFYDLHQLYHKQDLKQTILTPASFEILELAIQDDTANPTFTGEWLDKPLSSSPLFSSIEDTWKSLIPIYKSDLSQIVWSDLPSTESILDVLQQIKEFLKKFDKK